MKPDHSILPERERVEAGKRKQPTHEQIIEALRAQLKEHGQRCPETGLVFFEVDHIKPLWAGGKHEVENLQLLSITGHKIKCAREAKEQARDKRVRGETGQRAKRKKRGGSSIQSANTLGGEGYQRRRAFKERVMKEKSDG